MVSVNGNLSTEFDITTELLQGDTLAPFLFMILLDYILIKTTSDQGIIKHIKKHFFPSRSRLCVRTLKKNAILISCSSNGINMMRLQAIRLELCL